MMVGWVSTKSPMALAANIMTPTAMTMARIITGTWLAMPTAVITESRLKMISRTAICTRVVMKP